MVESASPGLVSGVASSTGVVITSRIGVLSKRTSTKRELPQYIALGENSSHSFFCVYNGDGADVQIQHQTNCFGSRGFQ